MKSATAPSGVRGAGAAARLRASGAADDLLMIMFGSCVVWS
jgi:hypothetical protein